MTASHLPPLNNQPVNRKTLNTIEQDHDQSYYLEYLTYGMSQQHIAVIQQSTNPDHPPPPKRPKYTLIWHVLLTCHTKYQSNLSHTTVGPTQQPKLHHNLHSRHTILYQKVVDGNHISFCRIVCPTRTNVHAMNMELCSLLTEHFQQENKNTSLLHNSRSRNSLNNDNNEW